MSVRDHLNKWSKPEISVMHDEGGITGLKLITDDRSVMMSEYIRLQDISERDNPNVRALFEKISAALGDEAFDRVKYQTLADDAKSVGREDIALALQIIAREEHNHHEILEALLPPGGLELRPDIEEPTRWDNTGEIDIHHPTPSDLAKIRDTIFRRHEQDEMDIERRLTGGPYDAGEGIPSVEIDARQDYLGDIAATIETLISDNSMADQYGVDSWLLLHKPSEVFTTEEHKEILELVNMIHTDERKMNLEQPLGGNTDEEPTRAGSYQLSEEMNHEWQHGTRVNVDDVANWMKLKKYALADNEVMLLIRDDVNMLRGFDS